MWNDTDAAAEFKAQDEIKTQRGTARRILT
jgi:hypothetical protein